MKEFVTLLKMNLNVNFGLSAFRYRLRRERDKLPQTLLVMLVVGISVGILVFLYSLFMYSMYLGGKGIGNPELVLVLAFLGLQLFLLITGIFYVMSVFYYSKDLSCLIPLPVKPWQVLLSKFSVVMAYEYLMALPMLLPPVLLYGLGTAQSFQYWIKAALLIVASPAIPLAIASVIAIVLMRFFNIGKRRDLFAIIGGSAAVVGIMSFNLWTQRFASSAGPDAISSFLAAREGLILSISRSFPPSAWATFSLAQAGLASWGYLALFLAVSAILVGVMLWLSNAFYYNSALQGEEVSRNKPGKPKKAVYGRESAPVASLFIKELRLLLRTPAFALNCLVGSIILPITIPLSLTQAKNGGDAITLLLTSPSLQTPLTLGAVGLILLASAINVTASTCVSREGKTFWMSRMIPVSPGTQIYAKFLVSYAVAAIGMALSFVVFLVFFHFTLPRAILALSMGVLGSIPITAISMVPDILRPKLLWTNPYEAVKQNMNVILAMVAVLLLVGLEVALTVALMIFGLPDWAVFGALTLLFLLLCWASERVLASLAKTYYKHEV
jgi:ABC-2 type transport system permease protein